VVIGGNERYRAVCPVCFYGDDDDPAGAPGLFA
jgi:thymidine kinase